MRQLFNICLLVTAAVLAGCQQNQPKQEPPKPMSVLFVTPVSENVTEEEEFTGRTAATETVELRARVSGYLNTVQFAEGTMVKKDQVLFTIDDRSFTAEEQRTAAAAAQFAARANRLEGQESRARSLFEKKAMSEEEYEAVKYELAEARASHTAALASHEIAKLNLDFTVVKAPISGRIGQKQVDVGNLVVEDQTLLATIVPLEKVYVFFDMDERTVLRLRRMEQSGSIQSAMVEPVQIGIALADSDEFSIHGTVDFLDNQVDPATGTLRTRATVDNSSGLLSPGLFVRVRYPIGKPAAALIVPEEALASDQGRPFVFVVEEKDGKQIAVAKYIEPGPLLGNRRVIRSGITAEDKVIVTGLQRLRRNAEIAPKPQTATTPAPAVSAAR
ncbi:MAG: efflux RND transporter periplasmic adaptor subunit [Planctomycetaceae bacterium]